MADVNIGALMDAAAVLKERKPPGFFVDAHPSSFNAWLNDGQRDRITLQLTKGPQRGYVGIPAVVLTDELRAAVDGLTGAVGSFDPGQAVRLAVFVGRLAGALRTLAACKPGMFVNPSSHRAMHAAKADAAAVLAELGAGVMVDVTTDETPEQPGGRSTAAEQRQVFDGRADAAERTGDVLEDLRSRFDPRIVFPDEVSRRAAAEIERLRALAVRNARELDALTAECGRVIADRDRACSDMTQAERDRAELRRKLTDATRVEAAAVAELDTLRRAVLDVIRTVPDGLRVDVSSRTGADNLAATLAATVANVVMMHDAAAERARQRHPTDPEIAELRRRAVDAERRADLAEASVKVAQGDVKHWRKEATALTATLGDLKAVELRHVERGREAEGDAREWSRRAEWYRVRAGVALEALKLASRSGVSVAEMAAQATGILTEALARYPAGTTATGDRTSAVEPAAPKVTTAAEWYGEPATLVVNVNGRDARGCRLGFAEPGRPPVFVVPGDTALVIDHEGMRLNVHYAADLSPRTDLPDPPRMAAAEPSVYRALTDAQNRVSDLEAAIEVAGFAVQQMAGCVRLQHVGPEKGDDDGSDREGTPMSSDLDSETEERALRAQVEALTLRLDGARVLLNFSELRCRALAAAMKRADDSGFVTTVTNAVAAMADHVRTTLDATQKGSRLAENFRAAAVGWASKVVELIGSPPAGFDEKSYRLPPGFSTV